MSNQKDNRNQRGEQSKEKSNKGGFEKKNPGQSDGQAQERQRTPNEEVPNVGDQQQKKGPSVNPNSRASVENNDQEETGGVGEDIVNENQSNREAEQPTEQESK